MRPRAAELGNGMAAAGRAEPRLHTLRWLAGETSRRASYPGNIDPSFLQLFFIIYASFAGNDALCFQLLTIIDDCSAWMSNFDALDFNSLVSSEIVAGTYWSGSYARKEQSEQEAGTHFIRFWDFIWSLQNTFLINDISYIYFYHVKAINELSRN